MLAGDYLLYTTPDGTRYKYTYPDSEEFAIGQWQETISPSGENDKVTRWTDGLGNTSATYGNGYTHKSVVEHCSTVGSHADKSESYTYTTVDGHVLRSFVTYTHWNSTTNVWVNDSKVWYYYYDSSGSDGQACNLKAAATQYWDGSDWAGNDTIYYRYYVDSAGGTGFAYGMKRELLANAFNALANTLCEPDDTIEERIAAVSTVSDSSIAAYTCFYYRYDSDRRVTYEEVYGQSRHTTYEYFTGSDTQTDPNLWIRKTVETRMDDSTYTVYTNFLGSTIFSDLYDPAADQHTFTYCEYDANGRVILDAQSAAIAGYWDGKDTEVNYTGDELTDFVILLNANATGLVNTYTYYTSSDSPQANESTAGAVADYLKSDWVANGLDDNTPVQIGEYTYYTHTANGQTVYVPASQTAYSNEDGAGLIGHWTLDEQSGATAADSSAYGNTGTLLGNAVFSDGALTLDGTGDGVHVQVDEGSALDIYGADLTISAWVYADQLADYQYIAAKRNGPDWNATATQYGLYVAPNGKVVFCSRGSNFGDADAASPLGLLTVGQWHQVVAVYKDRGTYGDVAIYLDGEDVTDQENATCAAITHAASDLYIGARGDNPDEPHTTTLAYGWDGQLDDVRIYDRALSADEVSRQYNGAATTEYAYAWHDDSLQVKEIRTTLPAIYGDQNGPDASDTRFEYYNDAGQLTWSADERRRFTHYEYDALTGLLDYMIEDADASDGSLSGLSLYFVDGGGGSSPYWPDLPTDGLHLQTNYEYDAFGRVSEVLGPEHVATIDVEGTPTPTNVRTATWTVYKDADHETWTAQGYKVVSTGTYTLVNPVSITKTDRDGRVTEQIQAVGSDGKATVDFGSGFGSGYGDAACAVATQSDGKIVVAGYVDNGSDNDFAIARFTADGILDTSFGTSGVRIVDFGSGDDAAYALAIQSDGKIVVAGYAYNGRDNDFALVRLTTSGAFDGDFDGESNGNGKITRDFSNDDLAYAVAIQPDDGKIVVAGESNGDFIITRFETDGTLDMDFDSDGIQTADFNSGSDAARALAIQSDGMIVAAGYADNGSNNDFALVRLTTGGAFDGDFDGESNGNGKITCSFGSGNDAAYALAIQPDGKIAATGYAYNGSDNDIALARFNSDGTLDASFSGDGKATVDFGSGNDAASAVAIQSAGGQVAILAAGYADNGSDSDFALTRCIAGDVPDPSFHTDIQSNYTAWTT